MSHTFQVPTLGEELSVTIENGASAIFVGPNGGGKTRLSVHIENTVGEHAHRISAHRALNLNPKVAKISEEDAKRGLRYGSQNEQLTVRHRTSQRWGDKQAVGLLNDFDFLVQSLFADQANISLKTHKQKRSNKEFEAEETSFEKMQTVWNLLLPKKQLEISGDNILVSAEGITSYPASQMSDGERAIFYMVGQTLMVENNTLIIVDEPELHVHPSIMSKLWDELESMRSDCSFVFITHDLAFAAQRSAQKYVIRDYLPEPIWEIEEVPTGTGFDEELNTLILGSRKPILFVEGRDSSWDIVIYRACYPTWTVIPYGSCEEVLHAVATMRRNASLTRVTCAGIVDADSQSPRDIENLQAVGVEVLPVSEIENIFLLPEVSEQLAKTDGYDVPEVRDRIAALTVSICTLATGAAADAATLRFCKRRIDSTLKRLELNSSSIQQLARDYDTQTTALDIEALAREYRARIDVAVQGADITALAREFDNKGFAAEVALHLKSKNLREFKSWVSRALRNDSSPALVAALKRVLPSVTAG